MYYGHLQSYVCRRRVDLSSSPVDADWLREEHLEIKPNIEEKNRDKLTVQGFGKPVLAAVGSGQAGRDYIQRPQCLSSGNVGYYNIKCYELMGHPFGKSSILRRSLPF